MDGPLDRMEAQGEEDEPDLGAPLLTKELLLTWIDEHLQPTIRDLQYRVAELEREVRALKDAGTPPGS